jgi:hypothetical protein
MHMGRPKKIQSEELVVESEPSLFCNIEKDHQHVIQYSVIAQSASFIYRYEICDILNKAKCVTISVL